MPTLSEQFVEAQQDVKALSRRPDNDTMLNLYALFKQATEGDAKGERPGGFDFVARAKFDAWSNAKGTSTDEAMRQYVALVRSLKR